MVGFSSQKKAKSFQQSCYYKMRKGEIPRMKIRRKLSSLIFIMEPTDVA
jgi:hypothetical protein